MVFACFPLSRPTPHSLHSAEPCQPCHTLMLSYALLHTCTTCCHTFLTSALSCTFHPHLRLCSHASGHLPMPCPVSPWLPLSILYHPYHTFLPSPLFLDHLAMLLVYNACNYTSDQREFSTLLPSHFQSLRAPCSSSLTFLTVLHACAASAT
jgi:hypothetical protein